MAEPRPLGARRPPVDACDRTIALASQIRYLGRVVTAPIPSGLFPKYALTPTEDLLVIASSTVLEAFRINAHVRVAKTRSLYVQFVALVLAIVALTFAYWQQPARNLVTMTAPDAQSQPAQPQPEGAPVQPAPQWTPPPPDPELMGEIRTGYTTPNLD